MKKVIAIVRLMSTPISWAASRSIAVERIARPIRVRLTKSWRATMSDTDTTMAKMLTTPTLTPATSTRAVGG